MLRHYEQRDLLYRDLHRDDLLAIAKIRQIVKEDPYARVEKLFNTGKRMRIVEAKNKQNENTIALYTKRVKDKLRQAVDHLMLEPNGEEALKCIQQMENFDYTK